MMKTVMMNYMRAVFFIICTVSIALMFMVGVSYGQKSVKIISDPANGVAPKIEQHLATIKQGINKPESWKGITLEGEHPAVGLLNNLIDTENIYSVRTTNDVHLLARNDGTYEVHDMYVKTADSDTLHHKSLVLQFDDDADLIGVKMEAPIHNFQLALDRKVEVLNGERRAVINQIDQFQNALRNADKKKLETLLTENAHIVKGDIARYYFEGALGPYFRYSLTDSKTFIEAMTSENDKKPQIQYDDITVYQFPKLTNVYVATFYQQWKVGDYSDIGNVAMVVDLRDEPSIPLRVWQERSFETGYLEGNIEFITNITVPSIRDADNKQQKLVHHGIRKVADEPSAGFLHANKQWLIMGAGASAAISVGAILLSGDGDTELPDPPGRPSIR